MKIPAAGGSVIELAKGAPFVSLSGIAVAGATVYVLDNTTGGTTIYALVTPTGSPTPIATGLLTNFPGGIAVVQDGTAVLVAAFDPSTGKDSFARIVLSSGAVSYLTPSSVAGFGEPGGLHRSAGSDTYAWVDGTANSGGIVSVLK
jgi:DNA-binding beta-propeller fold protein YncE